jgi:23S rRNA pseudouridine1911/1915/1917 synthase
MFASRTVKKEYLALCVGNPGNRMIDAPIGRHPVHRKQMAVVPEGRDARTECETLDSRENISFVRLKPETGRTHQIRVHLKHVNAPILGDSLYGSVGVNKRYGAKRQMLHAHRLAFNHPVTEAPLQFKAELPEDMLELLRKNDLQCDY